MALTLTLNGVSRSFAELSEGATVSELLGQLSLNADRVAMEWNGEIVPRSAWEGTHLRSGDKLEVVHFVGGG